MVLTAPSMEATAGDWPERTSLTGAPARSRIYFKRGSTTPVAMPLEAQ